MDAWGEEGLRAFSEILEREREREREGEIRKKSDWIFPQVFHVNILVVDLVKFLYNLIFGIS